MEGEGFAVARGDGPSDVEGVWTPDGARVSVQIDVKERILTISGGRGPEAFAVGSPIDGTEARPTSYVQPFLGTASERNEMNANFFVAPFAFRNRQRGTIGSETPVVELNQIVFDLVDLRALSIASDRN